MAPVKGFQRPPLSQGWDQRPVSARDSWGGSGQAAPLSAPSSINFHMRAKETGFASWLRGLLSLRLRSAPYPLRLACQLCVSLEKEDLASVTEVLITSRSDCCWTLCLGRPLKAVQRHLLPLAGAAQSPPAPEKEQAPLAPSLLQGLPRGLVRKEGAALQSFVRLLRLPLFVPPGCCALSGAPLPLAASGVPSSSRIGSLEQVSGGETRKGSEAAEGQTLWLGLTWLPPPG